MATASSVQREPSMEEILASIRRIIEDSDGGRTQPTGATGSSAQQAPDLPDDTAAADTPQVEAFRSELRTGHAESEPRKPVSLAEVQAQLASGETTPETGELAGSVDSLAARRATLAEVGARIAAEEPVAASEPPAATADRSSQQEAAGELPEEAIEALDIGREPSAEEPQIEIDDKDLVIDDETPAENAFRPALVSEQTSRQVAAAFEELSEAFASRSKKSLDEMAEEMLRPMLQDWLDNNLPVLVERLVREEIERVARGAA